MGSHHVQPCGELTSALELVGKAWRGQAAAFVIDGSKALMKAICTSHPIQQLPQPQAATF